MKKTIACYLTLTVVLTFAVAGYCSEIAAESQRGDTSIVSLLGEWRGDVRMKRDGDPTASIQISVDKQKKNGRFSGFVVWKGKEYTIEGWINGGRVQATANCVTIRGQVMDDRKITIVAHYSWQGRDSRPLASGLLTREATQAASLGGITIATLE